MAQDEGAAVCGAAPFGELRAAAAAASRLLWLFINGNGSLEHNVSAMKFFFFILRLLWLFIIVEAAATCVIIGGSD